MLEITLRLPADRPATLAVDANGGVSFSVVPAATCLKSPIVTFGDRAIADALASGEGEAIVLEHVRRNSAAFAATVAPRFVKISADGDRLPADAKQWAGVLDTHHQLLWSAEEVGGERLNHADAPKACAELILCAGPARLPTRAELLTLVDDTRHEPAIDLAFFPTCRSNWYWTSTPAAWSPSGYAWIVSFGYGLASYYRRSGGAFVRAVRSVGASPGQ
jgi:hypothetical protein